MMNKGFRQVPVTLELTTTSAEQKEIQQKEIHTAQLYDNGLRKIVKYDEQVEEQGIIHNTMIITEREVKVIRHGAIEMNQAFKLGEATTGLYQTRYGALYIETKTHACSIELEEGRGSIMLDYELRMNGQWADRLALQIEYRIQPKKA